MKTFFDNLTETTGWRPWKGKFALNTLYHGEYLNNGDDSSTINRVKWPGYHVIASADKIFNFTIRNFFNGDSWLPDTNIPYDSGL